MLFSGELGLATFAHILADPRTRGLPLVLETPAYDEPGPGAARLGKEGMDVWRKEVEVLNRLAGENVGVERMAEWMAEIREVVRRASGERDAKGKQVGRGRTRDDEECESCGE